jgi:hypothetical protein
MKTYDPSQEVRSTAPHVIHMQFDISAYAAEIGAVQSPKYIVWCPVDCTEADKGEIFKGWLLFVGRLVYFFRVNHLIYR